MADEERDAMEIHPVDDHSKIVVLLGASVSSILPSSYSHYLIENRGSDRLYVTDDLVPRFLSKTFRMIDLMSKPHNIVCFYHV